MFRSPITHVLQFRLHLMRFYYAIHHVVENPYIAETLCLEYSFKRLQMSLVSILGRQNSLYSLSQQAYLQV